MIAVELSMKKRISILAQTPHQHQGDIVRNQNALPNPLHKHIRHSPPASPRTQRLFRNRPDPADRNINTNHNRPDDVKHLPVVLPIVPEDNGKHDTTQIPHRACETRHNTISMRVNMRHKPEIRAIGALKEDSQAAHKPHHGAHILGVQHTDDDQKHAGDDLVSVQHDLLRPHAVARVAVGKVRDVPAERARDAVEQAEHGGPVAGDLERHPGEVVHVVVAQDAVDAEFRAEGAEVACGWDEGLEGEHRAEDALEGGLLDDFGCGGVVCGALVMGVYVCVWEWETYTSACRFAVPRCLSSHASSPHR